MQRSAFVFAGDSLTRCELRVIDMETERRGGRYQVSMKYFRDKFEDQGILFQGAVVSIPLRVSCSWQTLASLD